jgi:kelch-like protein 17 (actinfilin)/kelch-like protein 20
VAVVDGKIYAVGGYDDTETTVSSVECLDPSTEQWSPMAPMGTARYNHGVAVVDGKLYAVGGYDDTGTTLSSVECFDPSTGHWSAVVPMSTARNNLAVVALECPGE